jgi:integrase
MRRGDWVDPALGRERFSACSARFLKTKINVRPSTFENIESRLRRHVLPTFGAWPIGHIRPSDVRAWLTTLIDDRLASDSANKCMQSLGQVLRMAMVDGAISRNPVDLVDALPSAQRNEIRPATLDAIRKLADAIDPRYRAAVMLAALTGLRAGELWALRVSSVNFLGRSLRVAESADDRGGFLSGR